MEFNFRVSPDDGDPFEVKAKTRDVLSWEKTGPGRALTDLVGDVVRLTDLYSLAWTAAKRQGLYTGSLEEFETSADLVSRSHFTGADDDQGDDEQQGDGDPEAADEDRPTPAAR